MPSDSKPRMDSSGSGSDCTGTDLSSSPGASVRIRTDSESSERQTRFLLPSADGSPPKVLKMDEVVEVVKNIQNMTLAHEIALNPEFKLQPYEPPENSLEHKIKEIMHKAFWDVLRTQINTNPPCYDHAIQLLADIKECFPQIISTNNQRLLGHINEVLDSTVIRQQAVQGVLNFKLYAQFVIDIMAKSCAPIRDDDVKKLSELDDVVETFKGILETMTVMKLDMANCLLELARNDLLANSVEYEKQKFKEYLEYYKLGFPATEGWLKRNQIQDINGTPCSAENTIYKAYMELLAWNEENEFPEILSMDKERLLKLGARALRLCACASSISIASGVTIISQRKEYKAALAEQIKIIMQNVTSLKDLKDVMENVAVQVIIVIKRYLEEGGQNALDSATESAIKFQLLQISTEESPVRNLIWKRLQTYFRLVLRSKTGFPPPPPGYEEYKEELESFATALKRVVAYNYSVFGEYYNEILIKANGGRTSNESTNQTESLST